MNHFMAEELDTTTVGSLAEVWNVYDLDTFKYEEYYSLNFNTAFYNYQKTSIGIYYFLRDTETNMSYIINVSTSEIVTSFYNPGAFRFAVFEE